MKKYKLMIFLLFILLLLPACGTQPTEVMGLPSSSAEVSSTTPSTDSSAESSSANWDSSSVFSSAPASSAPVSHTPSSSSPASSAQSVVSRLLNSSAKTVVMSSSLPPAAAPSKKPAPKPMPAVKAKMPQADGTDVFSQNGAGVDYSNAAQGYIMVKYSGSAKIKVLVYFNGGSSYYQYNIAGNGAYVTLPLQSGSGTYKVRFMENVSGNSYAELCATELNAAVTGSGYTVYPNQYANYTLTSAAVTKSKSLCAKSTTNAEKVAAIYKFITSTIKYDYKKANSVKAGYLPNVDTTLSTKKGICFDYSALMAAMCRSQGIPTKLVIGNTSAGYHAWNEVYLNGWKRYDATFAAAGQTAGTYTAEKYY